MKGDRLLPTGESQWAHCAGPFVHPNIGKSFHTEWPRGIVVVPFLLN